jgi:hypothetical protein
VRASRKKNGRYAIGIDIAHGGRDALAAFRKSDSKRVGDVVRQANPEFK